ncbi:DUF512 domain-containing protein [Eubacterium limosum]|uniref:DUF512 domain-containing protein n=1 Tax=Eubacterium limosum TaxID=1736 RepID=UPI0037185762
MGKFKIEGVAPGSIFEELEIEKGDTLLTINGMPVADIMDYRYLQADEQLMIEIEKPGGEIWELDVEKDFEEDLGLVFDENMLETRTCKNNCVFCFIDQMPPGMRETLYVKDDDERLSFLLGNYVTLTNLTEAEMERIVRYRIMPINISVHTTNPELRCAMLHNRFAGSIVESLRYFADNGIGMNGQIVLCPGYNDRDELSRTLNDLMGFYPQMASVSVVPVGLSKYREGLAKLDKFDAEGARETLSIIGSVQAQMRSQYGTNFVYASDEFFLLAGEALPDSSYYDGFPQIENGVGMMTDFKEGLDAALSEACVVRGNGVSQKVGIITGRLAADFMRDCAQKASAACGVELSVYPVTNDFFGEDITVSGLITGTDIIRQVPPGADRYLIPENMVRSQSHDLLDDVTTEDIEKALQAEVRIVPVDGAAFLEAMK